jgi:RNA polymerase sigma factor (sigma-70 family)
MLCQVEAEKSVPLLDSGTSWALPHSHQPAPLSTKRPRSASGVGHRSPSASEVTPDSVHERLAPVVKRVVWTVLGADRDIDDITHDVFVSIFQGLSTLKTPERLEQWAARVAINTVFNALRRRRYRRTSSWNAVDDPDLLVSHTDFESGSVARRVAQVFAHMPKSEQALLDRRWFGSATIEDIAREESCSGRTVKRRLHRALERFERCARKDAEIAAWLESHGGAANGNAEPSTGSREDRAAFAEP